MDSGVLVRPCRFNLRLAQAADLLPSASLRTSVLPPVGSGPRARLPRLAAASSTAISPTEAEETDVAASHSSPYPDPTLMRVTVESLQYESGFLGGISEKTPLPAADRGANGAPSPMEYLTNILSSKAYDVAIESPLQFAPKLSQRLGVNLWLKREDLQPGFDFALIVHSEARMIFLSVSQFYFNLYMVFSFKLRGAYNMMSKLLKEQLDQGVICSSAGNHAQGVALAAQKLGCDAVIVMPVTTPEIKWRSVQRLGATVVLKGDSYDEAQLYAKQRAESDGRTFIPPFDHPDIIMGQGTVGMEIVRQIKGPLHAIFVPVGGGGLIAGIATYIKCVCPEVKVIGVEPFDANAMALSLYHGQRVMLEQVGGFADGVAVKVVGEETFRLCRDLVDGVVLVSRDAICASIKPYMGSWLGTYWAPMPYLDGLCPPTPTLGDFWDAVPTYTHPLSMVFERSLPQTDSLRLVALCSDYKLSSRISEFTVVSMWLSAAHYVVRIAVI
ncbi:Threonine dehydratase biosynthetic, chloroplastic [Dendrobium catenatum]|uniref:Threonine dehydratase biosynthetic, chloroplastic n=1 Tax=Dendrobium catenatum TaxID=906689 RepID=A0A2I0VEB7_9ASPA|nr:Threonine dehydratase biosynthetic, chloroplastic [Dendrobium catenatum]